MLALTLTHSITAIEIDTLDTQHRREKNQEPGEKERRRDGEKGRRREENTTTRRHGMTRQEKETRLDENMRQTRTDEGEENACVRG
jgi:hypothetical protein